MKDPQRWHPTLTDMKQKILQNLSAECPWRDTLHWYHTTESTNNDAKAMASQGAPHGTVIMAGTQTGGRGRMGRTFLSPADSGIYMSVILRPTEKAGELLHLTCAAAVAACDAIEAACGFRPQVKWINDLIFENKKLGGILTELSIKPDGNVEYAIIGIGINVLCVPEQVQSMATSLTAAAGKAVDTALVAAALIQAFAGMDLSQKKELMHRYSKDCLTLNREIQVIKTDGILYGKALRLTEDGSLQVLLNSGKTVTVSSGEVSVRGMYGYL